MHKIVMTMAAVAACLTSSSSWAQSRPDIWSGAYAGLQIGGAENTLQSDKSKFDLYTGTVVGGRLGYNFQGGNLVYGVEANGSAQFGERKDVVNHSNFPTPHRHEYRASIPVLGDVRGKIGYALGSGLVYAFAGVAVAQLRFIEEYHSAAVNTSSGTSKSHGGVVFGFGAAYKFSNQVSGDLEVSRYQIGETLTKSFDYANGVFTPVGVRAGLNYHFN